MDSRFEWTFDEQGWRPLAIGAAADRGYLWSARGLIVLPGASGEDPERIAVDEDLLFVFCVDASWILVCETSVRRVAAGKETARVEFGEVLEHAMWESSTLVVEETSGLSHRIVMRRQRPEYMTPLSPCGTACELGATIFCELVTVMHRGG